MLNVERDAAVLFASDEDAPEADEVDEVAVESAPAEQQAAPTVPAPAAAPPALPGPTTSPSTPPTRRSLWIALSAKMRIDQIEPLDSSNPSPTEPPRGATSCWWIWARAEPRRHRRRRRGRPDQLRGQVAKLARTYKPFGPVLTDAVNDQLRSVLGPSGKRPAAIADRLTKTWELGPGWSSTSPSNWRWEPGRVPAFAVGRWATCTKGAARRRRGRQGDRRRGGGGGRAPRVAVALPSAGGGAGGGVVDSAALDEFAETVTGRDGVLASAARLVLGQLGLDNPVSAPRRPPTPS